MTSESDIFVKATSENLPKVDSWMLAEFFASNSSFTAAEIRGFKDNRAANEVYGDSAVGYVEICRNADICIVKLQICPEHKVRQKNYRIEIKIDEVKNEILHVKCFDCAASSGGCKHMVASIWWVHRRSEEPARTSVECYWKKPKLSIHPNQFLTLKDFGACDVPSESNVEQFRQEVVDGGFSSRSHSTLLNYFRDKAGPETLDINYMLVNFSGDDFLSYAASRMDDTICQEVLRCTEEQHNSTLWKSLRYGRVTASKIYDVAHCRTADGVLVEQILGSYNIRESAALKRGRELEPHIRNILVRKTNIKFAKCGLFLSKMYPFLGASPDGLSEEHTLEIKCPMSQRAISRYLTKAHYITAKCNAQVQLQMYLAGVKKAIFCVADPDFEKNKNIMTVEVAYDKELINYLIEEAKSFWCRFIFPIMHTE